MLLALFTGFSAGAASRSRSNSLVLLFSARDAELQPEGDRERKTAPPPRPAVGDNPERLQTGVPFAALCGVSPIESSSGKIQRHRLDRGGNRQTNAALFRIALTRLLADPRTRDYAKRGTTGGRTKREILRCLKRYIAREIFKIISSALAPAAT